MGHRPLFIVIEGLDGSGKTTQIEMLRDHLQTRGEGCHVTAEPTNWPTGRLIRSILRGEIGADPRTVAALFAADRIEHIHRPEEGLLAQLAAGYHVIASRYYFSSLAYQSEHADPNWIAALNHPAKQALPADITLFLDLPPEVSMQRIADRQEQKEIFETQEKLTLVREGFHRAFEAFGAGENIQIIDAQPDPVTIADRIIHLVDQLLE